MKKHGSIGLYFFIILSLALQTAAIVFLMKIYAFDGFLFIRSKINNAAALSTGMIKYKDVDITPSSMVLKVPSLNNGLALIPDKDDYTVFVYSNNLLVYSLEASEGSARSRVSYYTDKYRDFEFTSTGSMLGFKCRSAGTLFSSLKYIPQEAILIPESLKVF